jgi:hypothetical protein
VLPTPGTALPTEILVAGSVKTEEAKLQWKSTGLSVLQKASQQGAFQAYPMEHKYVRKGRGMPNSDGLSDGQSAVETLWGAGLPAEKYPSARSVLTLSQICDWFDILRRRRVLGESVPSVREVADRACVSRQTVYALLRNERSEFGQTAQIRLSRVIQQISADPCFMNSRLLSIKMTPRGPMINLSGH